MPESTETFMLARTQAACGLCEDYAAREAGKPMVVMACEGACLRGELARLAANYLCDDLLPERTARLCLGGAFTKDTGQRNLARKAPRVVAIEGCPINCASRMMQAAVPGLAPEIFHLEGTRFDQKLFSIKEMPEPQRKACAMEVARAVRDQLQI